MLKHTITAMPKTTTKTMNVVKPSKPIEAAIIRAKVAITKATQVINTYKIMYSTWG